MTRVTGHTPLLLLRTKYCVTGNVTLPIHDSENLKRELPVTGDDP